MLVFTTHPSLNSYKTWTQWNCALRSFHSHEFANIWVLTGKGGRRQRFGYHWQSCPRVYCLRSFSENCSSDITQYPPMWNTSLDQHSRILSSKKKMLTCLKHLVGMFDIKWIMVNNQCHTERLNKYEFQLCFPTCISFFFLPTFGFFFFFNF